MVFITGSGNILKYTSAAEPNIIITRRIYERI